MTAGNGKSNEVPAPVPDVVNDGGNGNEVADGGRDATNAFQQQSEVLRFSGPTVSGGGDVRMYAAAVGGAPEVQLVDSGEGDDSSVARRLKRRLDPAKDAGKNVRQLVEEGVFKDGRTGSAEPAQPAEPVQSTEAQPQALEQNGSGERNETIERAGRPPEIVVGLEDVLKDQSTQARQPDFRIKADGTVEVLNDFESNPNPDKNIVVEIEREEGQTAQTAEQAAAAQDLVRYLDGRVKSVYPEAMRDGVTIKDEQGLVPESTEQNLGMRETPSLEGISDPTREAIERTNRYNGSGSGRMSRDDAESHFPSRYVERQENESDRAVTLKDMVASLFNPDREAPYGTVRRTSDNGYAVGRYGLSYAMFWDWLEGMEGFDELGDPPDPKKLKKLMAKLEKQGKVPKGFADKFDDPQFGERFTQFLDKMKTGEGQISPQELKEFLPPNLQEAIATDLVEKYSRQAGGDPGLVALAFSRGKPLDELTQADRESPQARQIREAGKKLHEIADKKLSASADDNIEWSSTGGATSNFAARLVRSAHQADNEYNRRGEGRSGGQCAAAVQVAFSKAGWGEFLGCGDAWQMRHKMLSSGKFDRVDNPGAAREGDVILWKPNNGGSVYGHIEIVTRKGGNGLVATSDFTHTVTADQFRSNKGGYYGGYMILRPRAA